jgi:hypothetical protein
MAATMVTTPSERRAALSQILTDKCLVVNTRGGEKAGKLNNRSQQKGDEI